MFRLPLATSGENFTVEQFWKATVLFHDRPHLVNRRIVGVSQTNTFIAVTNLNYTKIIELLTPNAILYEIRKFDDVNSINVGESFIKSVLECYDKSLQLIETASDVLKSLNVDDIIISTRILFPRNRNHKKCVEINVFDKKNNVATFLAANDDPDSLIAPPFPIGIELNQELLRICVRNVEDAEHPSCVWLVESLFPKLIKWTQDILSTKNVDPSLSLVDMEKYCNVYKTLKTKYGRAIVKIWPENTDPLKFVYEDVAIATYLIVLWQRTEGNKKIRFVDLGCGNGLLVHILNQEGHPGYGIDVRKRKIWDLYPETTRLKITTIIPSSNSLFPDADWIIGNHSDELTPWIPVIASRSSYNCKYFLLPCCCYEFNGKKYQRLNSSQSQYSEYIDYVKRISERCGFQTEVDKLRIPSTKRKCLIGNCRLYSPKDFNDVDDKLKEFISERSKSSDVAVAQPNWITNFEPRVNVERVKNCTQLDKQLQNSIVRNVFMFLLNERNYVEKFDGSLWNAGATTALPLLVKIIPSDELQKLKRECGGLQTLLRNHHQIFEVKQGTVKIRTSSVTGNTDRSKTRQCWFQENHPNGCFYSDTDCTYKHC